MFRSVDQLRLRLRSLFRRAAVDRELDEELQYHLDRQVEQGIARGLSPSEARRTALVELGAIKQAKEACRDTRRLNWIEHLTQDLRFGARNLRKNPAFAAVAILAVALGTGATTAMFSVGYGILVRPLPYPAAGRVAVVYLRYAPRDFAFGTMSIRDFQIWRAHNRSFDQIALVRQQRVDLGGGPIPPEQVQGAAVTADFFSILGVRPLIGRFFAAGEDRPAGAAVAVLRESLWRRRFSASPAILGQAITVNGAPATIIGVVSDSFAVPRVGTDLWTNLPLDPPSRFGPWFYRAIGLLKPGVTLEQAQSELDRVAGLLMDQNPYYKRAAMPALPLREALLGTSVRPALLVLMGAVGLVLLIAAVNVANLLLARATVREREMALRRSLGAARGRIVRQLLTESVLLSLLGGSAGIAFSAAAIRFVRVWNPGNLPFIESVRLDGRGLAFMLAVSTFTGILFGLAPALESLRTDLNSTLKDGGRGATSSLRGATRAALVVSEIAISLMLLIGAGLLIRSFVNLQNVNGGFFTPPNRVYTVLISPGARKYAEPAAGLAFYDEVLRRARAVPGIETAALTDSLPPDRQGDADSFRMEGQTLAPGELNPVISHITATPGFFEALGIPLVQGRNFNLHDDDAAPPVAIVSQGFTRRFLPDQSPIGKRLQYDGTWMEIVGVVGNVKYLGLTADTDPAYYLPFAQSYSQGPLSYVPRMTLVARTSGEASVVGARLLQTVQAIDPGVTLAQAETIEQAMTLSLSQPRFDTLLLLLFAGMALLLAAVGIYGLVAYSVAQRTHEIGIRMALGADRTNVLGMLMRRSVTLALSGIGLGLAGAFALTRLLSTMLFGVGITDAATFALAPVTLMLVVLAATVLPALRAARISPTVALRHD